MARVNINILGISELKWTRTGEFNSDDYYIYHCGQEPLGRNGVAIKGNKRVQNAVLGCNKQKTAYEMVVCDWSSDVCSSDLSPVTSTTGCCFCFGSVSSFFLELFLHVSPITYWAPTNLGSSSFSVLFLPFHAVHGGSQGKNTEVVCHSLLQWTTFCQNSP